MNATLTVTPDGASTFAIAPPAGTDVRRDVALAGFTTMKVGGAAEFLATVTTMDALIKLVRWARSVELPYYLLGGGSNILISDAGIRGLVIDNRCRTVRIDEAPCCVFPQDDRPYLMAESGAALAGAARRAVRAGLSGLEWAVSVPGTVGGALVGNAGAHGGEVKDNLEYALVMDAAGDVVEMSVADFDYGYRDSAIKRHHLRRAGFKPVVLNANFRLTPGDPAEIAARADEFLARRRTTQPVEPSLGSTFVNPPGDYAGRLIEAAGLKGLRMGGVAVSTQHANFIVNPGGVGTATAQDVLRLMAHIRATVAQRFHVTLQPEIQPVGEWSLSELAMIGMEA